MQLIYYRFILWPRSVIRLPCYACTLPLYSSTLHAHFHCTLPFCMCTSIAPFHPTRTSIALFHSTRTSIVLFQSSTNASPMHLQWIQLWMCILLSLFIDNIIYGLLVFKYGEDADVFRVCVCVWGGGLQAWE